MAFVNTIVAIASWLPIHRPRNGEAFNEENWRESLQAIGNRDKYLANALMPTTVSVPVLGQARTSQYDAPSAVWWSEDLTNGWLQLAGSDNNAASALLLCPLIVPVGKTILSVNAVVSSAATYSATPATRMTIGLYRKSLGLSSAAMSSIYTGSDGATYGGTPSMTTTRVVTATVPNTFHVADPLNYSYWIRIASESGSGARVGQRINAIYATLSEEGT